MSTRRGFFSGFGNGTVSATVTATLPGGSAAGDRFLAIAVVNGTNGSALSNPNTTDHPGLVATSPAGSNNNSNAIVITGILTSTDISAGFLTTTWAVSGRPAVAGVVFAGDPVQNPASPWIISTVALATTPTSVTTTDDNADVFEVLAFNETGVAPTVSATGYTLGAQASTTAGSGANMTAAIVYLATLGTAGTYGAAAFTASGATGPHSWTVALDLAPQAAAAVSATASLTAAATTSGTGSTAAVTATASVTAAATLVPGAAAAVTATATVATSAGKIFDYIPKQIGVIGDSLTYQYGNGATDIPTAFAARGWNSSLINAVGVTGRQIWAGGTSPVTKDTIDTWRALSPPFDPYLYVLPLGANMADSGASQSQNSSDWLSLLAYIGPGRKCYVLGIGYQTAGEGATSFNSGGTLGSRYSCVGDASSPNAAILNLIDAGLDPKVYPTVVFCDWDASTEATTARAGGTTYWLSTDSSSPSGTARHMTVIGYQNYRNPFTARMLDSELGQQGTAAITASATVAAAATKALPGAAAVTATASLTAAATQTVQAAAAVAASATVAAVGTRVQPGAVAVTATASVTAAGTLTEFPAVAIAASASVTATVGGIQAGAAAIQAIATVTVAGLATSVATATITATASVTAGGVRSTFAAAAVAAIAQVQAAVFAALTAAAAVTATASVGANGSIPGSTTPGVLTIVPVPASTLTLTGG